MKLTMGAFNKLEVLRETEFAFMLGTEEQEIFLHKKQITKELEIGETVDVFLYFDNQKRVTATMNKPIVGLTEPAFLDVVDVNHRLGIFLNMGLVKDLLLSRDDLPFVRKEWPQVGDKLFVRLRTSKNQLTAKFIPRYEISHTLKPSTDLVVDEEYEAYNVYKTEEGNIFFTENGHSIYVYFKHMRKEYRLGEKETIRVKIDKGNYQYNGTITKQKEIVITDDALIIKKFLEENKGEMIYTDKSSADDINAQFHMSKSAFKRALGSLYKQGIILLEKDKTSLVDIDK